MKKVKQIVSTCMVVPLSFSVLSMTPIHANSRQETSICSEKSSINLNAGSMLTSYDEQGNIINVEIYDAQGEIVENLKTRAVVNPGGYNWKFIKTYKKKYASIVALNTLTKLIFGFFTSLGISTVFTNANAASAASSMVGLLSVGFKNIYYKTDYYTATDSTGRIYKRYDVTAYRNSDYTGKITSYSEWK